MTDLGVVRAVDQSCSGVVPVRFSIAPIAVTADVIELASYDDIAAGGPLSSQFGPAILELDAAVGNVVVTLSDRRVLYSVDQRCTEVTHRLLSALCVRQLQVEVRCHIPAQSAGDRPIAGIATIHPAIRLVATDIQSIRPLLIDRASAAKGQCTFAFGSHRGLDFILDRPARGLFGDHVDHATNSTVTVDHGCGSAQHFDAVDRPGVEGKTHTDSPVLARTVV